MTWGEPPSISREMLADVVPGTAPSSSYSSSIAPRDTRVEFEKGMPLAPPFTLLLIAVNAIVFFVTSSRGALQSREAIIAAGALVHDRVMAGEAWRMLSAPFLHGGFEHLAGNCVVLFILGMACEHAYGVGRTALLYFAAAIGGSTLSFLLTPGPSVGASGAIFGLMGAAIVFFRKHNDRFTLRDNRVGTVLLVWAAYSVVTAFFTPYIDNSAHIGGCVTGALLGYAMTPAAVEHAKKIKYYEGV